jgi:predicted DNA-binding transcriptional regulator YafY
VDRLERLVNLVAALIDAERPLAREQIRERVGGYAPDTDVFRRNFERDKELLRQIGLPLVLEPLDRANPEGPQGYRIPRERYELPDPGLTDDEVAALRLAASSVSIEGGWGRDASTAALRKLAATSGVSSPAPSTTVLPTDEGVAVAFGAVAARQALRFGYRGETRTVDPWHLSFRRGQWYLSGRDHDKGEERMFRLDRVEGELKGHGDPGAFVRPPGYAGGSPPPWRLGDATEVVADLRVDADQAEWAVATLGAGAVTTRESDGAVRVAVAVTNRGAFRSFVLGFLDHAEVVGPPELREDIVAWLRPLAAGPERPSEREAGPERPSEREAGPERPSEREAGPERPSEREAGPERPSEREAGPERPSEREAGPERPSEREAGPERPSEREAGPERPSEREAGPERPSER